MQPVNGTELKMRGYEVPRVTTIGSDQTVNVDGPLSGVGAATPATLHTEGVRQLPGMTVVDPAVVNPTISMSYGPPGARTAAQFTLADILTGGSSFYLGPKTSPPFTDNFGQPLKPGHMYFNLSDEVLYIWSSGGQWVISAASLPSAIKVYYYTLSTAAAIIPPNGPLSPDALGNILSFDAASNQTVVSGVNLYGNGVLMMNGVDYIVHEGGAGGDYITLAEDLCAGSVVVVQVFTSGSSQPFSNSVQINTTGWVYDGRVTFPLVDMSGEPIIPNNANNCLISQSNNILQPNVGFTINGDQVTFAVTPNIEDNIWGVIGLPTTGAEGEFGPRVTPFQHGGVGDGATDDSDAVEAAINQVNLSKATFDLAGGTWRLTRQMPDLLYPRVDGGGSGAVYVDYNMAGKPTLNCLPALGELYTVSAISVVTYDFNGVYTADSTLTRLTLSLSTGQVMPETGQIGKLTATNAIVGVEAGDNVGQHVVVVAVDAVNFYVYCPSKLLDTYTTGIQLQMLGQEQVILRNFGMYANWARVVAEDWVGSFIHVVGACFPKANDLWFRDGPQGILFAGTFMASSRGIRAGRLRNATASEVPAVPGYAVVDAGSYMSQHADIGGYDCRHGYTTVSPDAATWPRVAWGRTIKPSVNGGKAVGCSAAAFDTHSDCWEPLFNLLDVDGTYFGENSAGAGIQLRGVRGRIMNSQVRNCPVGYEIYKQFAGEGAVHSIENCTYIGDGTPIRVDRDPGLSAANAQQTVRMRDFYGETTGLIGFDISDAAVIFQGIARFAFTGAVAGTRALYLRAAATLESKGGKVLSDFSRMTGTPNPRLITFQGPNCGAANLKAEVIAGAVAWQAVVSEDDPSAAVAGAFVVDCEADTAPGAASGGYSLTGAGNLLTTGALQLILVLKNGRVPAVKTGAFSLTAAMNRQTILCSGTFTVTCPAVAVLGPDFWVDLIVTSGTVTLDGPGGTNPTVAAGNKARVQVAGTVIYNASQALGLLT